MNKVIQIGNLTKPPEVRATGSGVSVCTFRIAVQRRFSGQDGQKVSDFFDVVAWRTLADNCGRTVPSGTLPRSLRMKWSSLPRKRGRIAGMMNLNRLDLRKFRTNYLFSGVMAWQESISTPITAT